MVEPSNADDRGMRYWEDIEKAEAKMEEKWCLNLDKQQMQGTRLNFRISIRMGHLFE